jgi:hypothetical protein
MSQGPNRLDTIGLEWNLIGEQRRNFKDAGSSHEMIMTAERRFPVPHPDWRSARRLRPALHGNHAWLDQNCGTDGGAITPSGVRGVLNDAVLIYFLDATLAGAFVARWCARSRTETDGRRVPDSGR